MLCQLPPSSSYLSELTVKLSLTSMSRWLAESSQTSLSYSVEVAGQRGLDLATSSWMIHWCNSFNAASSDFNFLFSSALLALRSFSHFQTSVHSASNLSDAIHSLCRVFGRIMSSGPRLPVSSLGLLFLLFHLIIFSFLFFFLFLFFLFADSSGALRRWVSKY